MIRCWYFEYSAIFVSCELSCGPLSVVSSQLMRAAGRGLAPNVQRATDELRSWRITRPRLLFPPHGRIAAASVVFRRYVDQPRHALQQSPRRGPRIGGGGATRAVERRDHGRVRRGVPNPEPVSAVIRRRSNDRQLLARLC